MTFKPRLLTAWRYPVKSMMGEELNAAIITASGLQGDRAYALIDDETGKVVSAKNPRKWPGFFDCHARYADPSATADNQSPVWITTANGDAVISTDPEFNQKLSSQLGRKVSLHSVAPSDPVLEQYWPEREGDADAVTQEAVAADAPAGHFFDYAMLHIVTTASFDRLRQLYPAGQFEVRRFRPNLVIHTDPAVVDFVENDWVGKTLCIGNEVRIAITDPCPRCVMPTLAQGDLSQDPGILRAVAENSVHVPFAGKALPSLGVYARVIQGGKIVRGDAVRVE